ncbi:hypothetical protein AB0E75_25290 [Streptomyces griseoviridis]|uniref:NAD(+)--protein-arginine ADP-ribosyltransferase n=1 Tax=Streptomyces griseoviridis TaxID=45398 RepID=A0A918LHX8_STRGD|nr:hypothetical protein [Streptomyces niveoruber]GGS53465.1 hypothetical protein GCM10010238_48630 [Streptomyces niveoruber]
MKRWSSARTHRRKGAGPGADGAGPPPSAVPLVEDVDGLLLLRSAEDDSLSLAGLAEVARAVGVEPDTVTVLVGTPDDGPSGHGVWTRLGTLLDSLRDKGTRQVRLVMPGAGDGRAERASVARRIADAWQLDVIAPDGPVLITPGGTLFVDGGSPAAGAWWHFPPGDRPRKLGPRAPAPGWQAALGRLPARTDGGCLVEQIPTGVLIRPAQSPRPDPLHLCFAIPMDAVRPTVVVGVPRAEDVSADEVAAVLGALPAAQRAAARLAPGGRRDVLRLAQSVADMLAAEVEVLTGVPLLPEPPDGQTGVRPTVVGSDGKPGWQPFVGAVACRPAGPDGQPPPPRVVEGLPLPLGRPGKGTVPLTERWNATATRAGLVVWDRGGPPPPLAELAVDPDTCTVELGLPGQPVDDSILPALTRLLIAFGPRAAARVTLLVRGRLLGDESGLRRLAAQHAIPGIRYVTSPGARGAARRDGATPRTAPVGYGESGPRTGPAPAVRAPSAKPETRPGDSAGAGGRVHAGTPDHDASERAGAPPRTRGTAPSHEVLRDVLSGTGSRPGTGGGDGLYPRVAPSTASPGGAERDPAPASRPRTTAALDAAGHRPAGPPETGPRPSDPEEERPRHEPAGRTAGPSAPAPRPDGDEASGRTGPERPPAGPPAGPAVPSRRTDAEEPPAGASSSGPGATGTATVPSGPDITATPRPGGPEVSGETSPAAPSEQPAPRPARTPAGTAPALLPGHVSSDGERTALRDLVTDWERHAAAVARVLTRMPALRGQQMEAARADLVAAHVYLTTTEGPLSHRELLRDLRAGEGRLSAYAACLASALRRLPSYRGVALRGAAAEGGGEPPEAGRLLQDPGPVSALAATGALPGEPAVAYAVWSVTGRKVRQLLDRADGAQECPDEIVFAPGSGFRVLGTRDVAGSTTVLLRELPPTTTAYVDEVAELSQLDRKALSRLEEALAGPLPVERDQTWPERCTGHVGAEA